MPEVKSGLWTHSGRGGWVPATRFSVKGNEAEANPSPREALAGSCSPGLQPTQPLAGNRDAAELSKTSAATLVTQVPKDVCAQRQCAHAQPERRRGTEDVTSLKPKASTRSVAVGKLRKAMVFNGRRHRTSKCFRCDLTKNRRGKVVSAQYQAKGLEAYERNIKTWHQAVTKARQELGIAAFCPVGGKTRQGRALYKKAKEICGSLRAGSCS